MIRALLDEETPEAMRRILNETMQKLRRGEVPFDEFILSKSMKATYKQKTCVQVVIRNKMQARQPGSEPMPGDRIRYVVLRGGSSKTRVCDKVEEAEYARQHNLPLDYAYYVRHNLKTAIERLFEAFTETPADLLRFHLAELGRMQSGTVSLGDDNVDEDIERQWNSRPLVKRARAATVARGTAPLLDLVEEGQADKKPHAPTKKRQRGLALVQSTLD